MTLWKKEFRSFVRSIVYVIFIILVVVFYFTQLGSTPFEHIKNSQKSIQYESPSDYNPLIKPVEGMESYGSEYMELPELIMPEVMCRLISDIEMNKFATYKFGFYKGITLNESEKAKVQQIVSDCTGLEYFQASQLQKSDMPIVCDYEAFKSKMSELEEIIGNGSNYSYDYYRNIAYKSLTFEEAEERYAVFVNKDKVSGAYARLFCDYMNIPALLFSVFAAVYFFMKDKRTGADETIFASSVGSVKLIAVRYTVCIAALMLPFIVLAMLPSVVLSIYGISKNISVDHFAYIKYVLSWILPTIMISVSVGALFTILIGNYSGVIVWFFIGLVSIISAGRGISEGIFGYTPAIRFNSLGNYQDFKNKYSEFLINRSVYTVAALLLLVVTIILYDARRRGILNGISLLKKRHANNEDTNKDIVF